MKNKHLILLLIIMFLFGSAFPMSKLALNSSIPPIMMGALRMGILFVCLLPFWRFALPPKIYFLPLLGFSLCMGFGVFLFMNLALNVANVVSPIIIGAQLAVPFGIICSYFINKEHINLKKCLLVILSFVGIIFIGFDPKLSNEIYSLFLASIMAFFYGLSQVFSRYLKNLDVKLTNSFMALTGFLTLSICSIIFESNTIYNLKSMSFDTWLLILHSAIMVSLFAHMSMFYLYKFYPVGKVLPFYSLFPIFGIFLTFIIFFEIPGIFEIIGGVVVIGSIYLIHKDNKDN